MTFVTPAFVGFHLTDLDTLVVREYAKDGTFTTLLDTALIVTDSAILAFNTSNDTTVVLLNYISGEEKYVFPDHDWQIYIPSQGIVVDLSGFVSPTKDKNCVLGGDLCPGCENPITSFLQDGQEVVPQYEMIKESGKGYLTYIHL